MMYITIGVVAAASLWARGAMAQDEVVSFATYYECLLNREAEADSLTTGIFVPIFRRYIAEGKLDGYSWSAHDLGGRWRRVDVFTGADRTDLLATLDEVFAELERRYPTEILKFQLICPTRQEYIWNRVVSIP